MDDTDDGLTFGERIRLRRERLGRTQEDVAATVACAPNTLRRWEKGTVSNIPAGQLARLARALDMEPEDMMRWYAEQPAAAVRTPANPALAEFLASPHAAGLEPARRQQLERLAPPHGAEHAAYYKVLRVLLEEGIPEQEAVSLAAATARAISHA